MAITSKYYVINPTSGTTSDYLDFDLSYGGGSISTVGANIVYNGTNSVDGIYVRPGMTYDLTNTSGSVDKIYFGGNLSEYAKTFESGNMVLQRTVNSTQLEKVTLDGGTSLNSDSLIFHDGKVSANTLYTSGATLPTLDTSETSISPVVPSPLNATIQAWSTNAANGYPKWAEDLRAAALTNRDIVGAKMSAPELIAAQKLAESLQTAISNRR